MNSKSNNSIAIPVKYFWWYLLWIYDNKRYHETNIGQRFGKRVRCLGSKLSGNVSDDSDQKGRKDIVICDEP